MDERIKFDDYLDGKSIREGFRELNALLAEALANLRRFREAVGRKSAKESSTIADLQKKINDLKKTIEAMNASTAAGRSGLSSFGSTVEGLADDMLKAKRANDAYSDSQEFAADSVKGIRAEIKRLKNEYESLSQSQDPKKVEGYRSRIALLNAEQKRLQNSLKSTSQVLQGVNESLEFNENTMNGLRKSIKVTKEELGDLEIGTRAYQRTAAKLDALREREIELRENESSLFRKRIQQAAGESKAVKKLADRLRELKYELASAPSDEMFKSIQAQIRETESQISAELSKGKSGFDIKGLAMNSLGALASPAGIAAAAGTAAIAIGKFALDTEKYFTDLRLNVERASGESGQALFKLTSDVEAISKTFQKENNEVIQAAKNFSKQYGISFKKALKLAEKGFLDGADATGEFLDKLKEYPVQFREAGFTAEEFIAITTQEVKGGVYNDKLVDSLKELGLSFRELDAAQFDALKNAFGEKFANELAAGLKSGQINAKQALMSIRDEFKRTGASAQQIQKISADLFKGAGEDAGGFVEILKQVDAALSSNNKELDSLGKKQKEQLEVQKKYAAEQERFARQLEGITAAFDRLFTMIKTVGVSALSSLLRLFDANADVALRTAENLSKIGDVEAVGVVRAKNDVAGLYMELEKLQKQLDKTKGQSAIFAGTLFSESGRANLLKKRTALLATIKEAEARIAKFEQKTDSDLEKRYSALIDKNKEAVGVFKEVEEQKIIALSNIRFGQATEETKKLIKDQVALVKSGAMSVTDFAKYIRDGEQVTESLISTMSFFFESAGKSAEKATKEVKALKKELGSVKIDLEKETGSVVADTLIGSVSEESAAVVEKLRAIMEEVKRKGLDMSIIDPELIARAGSGDFAKASFMAADLSEDSQREMDRLDNAMRYMEAVTEFSKNENKAQIERLRLEREILKAKYAALSADEKRGVIGVELQKAINDGKESELELQRMIVAEQLSGYTDIAKDALRKKLNQERLSGVLALAVAESYLSAIENGKSQQEALRDASKAGTIAVLAKVVGKFKDGVIDFQGKGSETSDSNIVAISNRESVITAKGTKAAPIALKMINEGIVTDSDLLPTIASNSAKLAAPKVVNNHVMKIDYDKLGRSVAKYIPRVDASEKADSMIIRESAAGLVRELIIKKKKRRLLP